MRPLMAVVPMLLVGSLAFAVGCGDASDSSTDESDIRARTVTVDGDRGDRLMRAFEALDVGTGGAGSSFVVVEKVACERNEAGSMACHFFAPGFTPEKKVITDARGKAENLYSALAAITDADGRNILESSGMQKSGVSTPKVSCTAADKCSVVVDEQTTLPITGKQAAAVNAALGAFGVSSASDVLCFAHGNGALDSRAPLSGVPTFDCTMTTNGKPVITEDPEHGAEALHASLRGAGLHGSDAIAKATSVRCKRSGGPDGQDYGQCSFVY